MADEGTLTELQQIKFFQGIAQNHVEKLAELCRPVEYSANKTIFEEYGQAKEVYMIVRGEVSLAICEPDFSCRQISIVRDGELIGWSPLVGRARLTDSAVTITPVRAYVFDGEELLEFCRVNPDFGFEFMHRAACVLSERLSGTRFQLLKMCGLDLPKVQVESD